MKLERYMLRVFDKIEKRYFYHVVVTWSNNFRLNTGREICIFNENAQLVVKKTFKETDVVIESCTGLLNKDKDRVIYEGDILSDREQLVVVRFDDIAHCFKFCYQKTGAEKYICDKDVLDEENFEIVGNVNQNEDLLK